MAGVVAMIIRIMATRIHRAAVASTNETMNNSILKREGRYMYLSILTWINYTHLIYCTRMIVRSVVLGIQSCANESSILVWNGVAGGLLENCMKRMKVVAFSLHERHKCITTISEHMKHEPNDVHRYLYFEHSYRKGQWWKLNGESSHCQIELLCTPESELPFKEMSVVC